MKKNQVSRRHFFKASALATGGLTINGIGQGHENIQQPDYSAKLPREVWIAALSQTGMSADTPADMVTQVLDILKNVVAQQPDIICLPEIFPFNVRQSFSNSEKVSISGEVITKFSAFARQHNCYMICPVYTSEEGKTYNAAVLIDRKGNRMGEYRKVRVTDSEVEAGITSGSIDPPVFKTDFGIIGIQICWDIAWRGGWEKLRQKGAEIIFWPSAFAAGKMINTAAWQNKCVVVSSTMKNTAKICDISGETVAQTDNWNPNLFWGPVNLEKAFINSWPHNGKFKAIQNKYGRSIRITTFDEEEWTIIESLSADIKIADILKEFKIPTYEQHLRNTEAANIRGGLQL